MLSYQHIYHAGNLADVQKHALLAWMLSYLTRKDKPLSYIETHAGRGLYQLDATEALKTGEAQAGIAKVLETGGFQDHPLMKAVADIRAQYGAMAYPGSPVLAANLLRPGDTMHLAELHPQEYAALKQAMRPFGANVYRQDGYELAQSITPPTPRRGLALIDPSYETESDYKDMSTRIARLHRKWNVGIIALWYPILTSGAHVSMLDALEAQDLPDVFRHEVRFPPVRDGHRMIGSGLFTVNAPYGIKDAAAEIDKLFGKIR
ncbi:23S rRNA (adenine(2030)-N(6))-methyltransferase RlmJ [Phaeobacter marinintestinus]|uniref:23S rRNA (adenine(2030)-N(6))-methyltransferase RlmJ n=1 Tax=Falsiphaeobacter marinintestinus TaxID=1492905 RepID=UPI0011B6FAE2|nr:23S rRNA (adenine(2030)-N(6))-methyltransferase RlmJ [Phaeobacter marinintestinus]